MTKYFLFWIKIDETCFRFDPIEAEPCPDKPGIYRLLDGAHRWSAFKSTGVEVVEAIIKDLEGDDPLLYAAAKVIGPKQLTEDEARDTARRAYLGNSRLSSADIGKAIGRARRTVDTYIADLRAATQMGRDIKIFRMNRLGIPQDKMTKRLGMNQKTIHNHLEKMAALPKLLNGNSMIVIIDSGMTGPDVSRPSWSHISFAVFQSRMTWSLIPWPEAG